MSVANDTQPLDYDSTAPPDRSWNWKWFVGIAVCLVVTAAGFFLIGAVIRHILFEPLDFWRHGRSTCAARSPAGPPNREPPRNSRG